MSVSKNQLHPALKYSWICYHTSQELSALPISHPRSPLTAKPPLFDPARVASASLSNRCHSHRLHTLHRQMAGPELSCKCHVADLEVMHINERQSIMISQKSPLYLTSGTYSNATEGQRTAHHWRHCWGFRQHLLWHVAARTNAWGRACRWTCTHSGTYRHCPSSHTHTDTH